MKCSRQEECHHLNVIIILPQNAIRLYHQEMKFPLLDCCFLASTSLKDLRFKLFISTQDRVSDAFIKLVSCMRRLLRKMEMYMKAMKC